MLSKCNINICELDSGYFHLGEIIDELRVAARNIDTLSMSEHALYLIGKRDALYQVIEYLNRVRG